VVTVLLGLLGSLFIGISDVFGGQSAERRGAPVATSVVQLVGLPILIAIAAIRGSSLPSGTDAALSLAVGALGGMGFIAFYAAMARGSVAIVIPVSAVVTVTSPVLVGVWRGETLSAIGWAGVALCLASIPLCALEPHDPSEAGALKWSPLRQVLVSMVCGLTFSAFYIALGTIDPSTGTWPTVLMVGASAAVAVISMLITEQRRTRVGPVDPRWLWMAVIGGVGLGVADFFNTAALQRGPLSIAAVMGNLYPLIAVLLAWFLTKRRPASVQLSGLGVGILCASLIGLA